RATRITAIISLFVGCMLIFNGRELLRVWVGEAFVGTYPLLVCMTIGYVVTFAQSPAVVLLIGRGRHREVGWCTLLEGLANLGLSIYWARRYGLIGVAWGTVVPMLVNKIVIQPWLVVRYGSLSLARYATDGFTRPAAVSVAFVAIGILLHR